MLSRLKKIWTLSKKDPKDLKEVFEVAKDLPDEDTKAEFLGAGTEREFKELEREDKGLKGIFGL